MPLLPADAFCLHGPDAKWQAMAILPEAPMVQGPGGGGYDVWHAKKLTPEGQLTASVRSLLRAAGIFHWKEYQTLGSYPGTSDIIGCAKHLGGRMIAIELKSPRGRPSPAQVRFIENVNDSGGLGFIAYDLDEVIEQLCLQDRFLIR